MDKLKKKLLFLIIIIIIGIVVGIIFSNILSASDEKIVTLKITDYFNNLKNDISIDYLNNLIFSIKNNFVYLLVIWIFGLSIIGLVLNNFILFFKSFIIGFIVGSIINIYLYGGIILSILYIFPSLVINILVYGIVTYYANNFSLKLFNFIFLKKEAKFSIIIKKYLKILGVCSICLIVSSILETFLTPFVIKLFSFLIK